VLYVTERCVFRLTETGLELIEIAPGIDLDRNVLAHMDFTPAISPDLHLMHASIFRPEPMRLLELLSGTALAAIR
jgi:propionate CoA-transferase